MDPKVLDQLFKAARDAFHNSYSPYSKCKVGSAVLFDGHIFSGTNVENASYGATVCAERIAIFSAVSAGHRNLEAIVVLTDRESPWPPCGMCRQVMVEFGHSDTKVYLANLNGIQKALTLDYLSPESFTAADL